MDFQPRAVALRGGDLASEPGGHPGPGVSLGDELLAGVPRGLRQTAAWEDLCLLFQRARAEENRVLDEESASEAEWKEAGGEHFRRGRPLVNIYWNNCCIAMTAVAVLDHVKCESQAWAANIIPH